jgi:hypothetical protein
MGIQEGSSFIFFDQLGISACKELKRRNNEFFFGDGWSFFPLKNVFPEFEEEVDPIFY